MPPVPPSVDPDGGTTVSIALAAEWLPALLISARRLLKVSEWSGSAADRLLATERAAMLIEMLAATLESFPEEIVHQKITVFTASGTFTPDAKMTSCRVQVQAAGGGSAGLGTNAAAIGGGAGAGGYSESILLPSDIGASKAVTVGAAGAAGTSGGGAAPTNGGASSLGTLVTANGGTAGGSANGDTGGASGGAAGTGQLAISGGDGGVSDSGNTAGYGGAAFLGPGGPARISTGNGNAPSGGYGGGAGGANGGGTSRAGAAGRPGIVIITELVKDS